MAPDNEQKRSRKVFRMPNHGKRQGDTDKAQVVHALTELPVFSSLDRRQVEALARNMRVEHVATGTVVIREGQTATFGDVGIVLRGLLTVQQGEKRQLGTIGPGEFFGEMAALDGGVRSATLMAATDTDVALLKEWNLRSVLRENPELAIQLLVAMSRRLREARASDGS